VHSKRISLCVSILLAALLCPYSDFCWAQDQPKRKPNPAPVAGKPVGPFTLPQTLEYIRDLSTGKSSEKQSLFQAYKSRGVDFTASPENLEMLKKAGADQEFFSLLTSLAVAPKPSPSAPATGGIEASCVPAECEISLGKNAAVPTQAGKWLFKGIEPGEVALTFSKTGYISAARTVRVQPSAIASTAVDLEPNAETRAVAAKSWLDQAWKVLGSGDRGSALQQIAASGASSLVDAKGTETQWKITARFSEKASSAIELAPFAGKGVLKFSCDPCVLVQDSGASRFFKGKPPGDQEESSILLTQFRRVHLGNMIARLTSPEVRVISADMKSSGDRVIQLEGNDETYEVELGAGGLVARILVRSRAGGDLYQVFYSDYVKLSDAAQYPRRTEYHMRTDKRGMKVEFTGPVSKPG
jgi:hypothetical protein